MPMVIEPEIPFLNKPIPPLVPNHEMSSLDEIVNSPPLLNVHRLGHKPMNKKASIGVMDFRSATEQGSSSLVSDTFSIQFYNTGMRVVERQNIKRIVEEQNMAATTVNLF